MHRTMKDYDVLVLGSGTAACSAAITCAGYGMKVLMADRYSAEDCKPCGDGLCEKGMEALASIGVTEDRLLEAGAHPVSRSVHIMPDGSRTEIPHAAKQFLTLPKPVLLQCLRQQAESAGVRIAFHVGGPLILQDGRWSAGDEGRASFLINASGCQTGLWQDGALRRRLPIGGSVIVSACTAPEEDTVWFRHLPDDPAGYCWAFPLGRGRWNLGVWRSRDTSGIRGDMKAFLSDWETNYASGVTVICKERYAFLGTQNSLKEQPEGCWAAAGDITGSCRLEGGEGISGAVLSGIAAAGKCGTAVLPERMRKDIPL